MAKEWKYQLVYGYVDTVPPIGSLSPRGINTAQDVNVVEELLNEGWECVGGPMMLDDHNAADKHLCAQAMRIRQEIED